MKKKHNKAAVTRCNHAGQTSDSARIVTLKLNRSLQPLESHFILPSVRLFFINAIQPPDFLWLSSDLR